MYVKAEEMFNDSSVVLEVCRFIGVTDIFSSDINEMLGRRVNVQQRGEFPEFQDWPEEQREALRRWCTLASKYGYDLSG
jgi:hypothetical protein